VHWPLSAKSKYGQDAPKMKTNQVQIELHVESVGYTEKEESY